MSEAVDRATSVRPREDVDFHERDIDELNELLIPGEEATEPVYVDDDRLPSVELIDGSEFEVNLDNFENFLPRYSEDNPPHINVLALRNAGLLLGPDGKLNAAAQDEYDQDPPGRQDCFSPEVGI